MIFQHASLKFFYICVALGILNSGCLKKKTVQQQTNVTEPIQQQATPERSKNIENLIDIIYGANGANLSLDQIFIIQDLFISLSDLKINEANIAAATIQLLKEKNAAETSQSLQILNSYIMHYLEDIASNQINNTQDATTRAVAEKIINYITLEQENIFNNEKSRHIFLTQIQRYTIKNNTDKISTNLQLPRLINFWGNEKGEKFLLNYHPTDTVKIQNLAFMAAEFGIAIATSTGASMANNEIGRQRQLLIEKINRNSQVIQTTMQTFQKQVQQHQQDLLQAKITAFAQAQEKSQKNITQASILSNLELDYLYQNISLEQPQQNYIFNQIQYDQLFTLGTMLTPQGPLWKNPFSVGDWEYDKINNSFWQNQSSPIYNKITDNNGQETNSSLQAENNAIFAEYYTNKNTYIIEGSITIYKIEYPFFAGVIFNKSRWISGDFESIRKCRMIGIYGLDANHIGIYFAQQYTMTDEQLKQTKSDSPIQTPLQQIVHNQIKPSLILPNDIFASLSEAPAVINFTITNGPTTVTFNFWNKKEQPTSPITINDLDAALFMHHGIGFICPGAIAQFKLTQPHDFIFSVPAVANYKD